ncbi:AAA family ATPase (plasmid) [Mammaliicoccus sciuri]|uniref:ParA family protein n=1 Tax=Mammaliicoccus sciuri TaxID=1296 RepID=UPI0023B122D3|nr:AAA family ATPase [Mammaliicoccus sciuri]MDE9962252.1 AAA family ATPase [Staphylococcus pseudintermedius]WQJ67258.1 AAA family ATPase [Mammaliicoccus sciuri]
MEIYTWVAQKGGVGKTMLCYNFAEYLAYKGKKVLLIDSDHSCNLSQIYNSDIPTNSIKSIYDNEEVKFHHIKNNIDLISGYYDFDKLEKRLEKSDEDYKDFKMIMWVMQNRDKLDKYDFIMFDTHNDFDYGVRNAIAVSDKVFSPDVPTGLNDKNEANMFVQFNNFKNSKYDFKTKERIVNADLYFIGNKVKHNTTTSKDFLAEMKQREGYITSFEEKDLFLKSVKNRQSIIEMMNDKKLYNRHKKFFNNFVENCEKILNV